jgi:hypothetical protein
MVVCNDSSPTRSSTGRVNVLQRVVPSCVAGGPPADGAFPKDGMLGLFSQLFVQFFHRRFHCHDAPPRRPSSNYQFHPLCAAIVFAAMWASANAVASDAADEVEGDNVRQRYCDPALAAISIWLVLVTVSIM